MAISECSDSYWCTMNALNDVGNRVDNPMMDSGFLPFLQCRHLVEVQSIPSESMAIYLS